MKKVRKGFTLIELLIVIAIIAILAAIAIPQFAKYRIRAYNSAAEADLRNAKNALEAHYTDYYQYPNAGTMNSTASPHTLTLTDPDGNTVDIGFSNGVAVVYNVSATNNSYVIATKHIGGDRVIAGDSDVSTLYYVQNNDWPGQDLVDDAPTTVPAATDNNDDLAAAGWNSL